LIFSFLLLQKDRKKEHILQKNTPVDKFNLPQGTRKKPQVLFLMIISPEVNSTQLLEKRPHKASIPTAGDKLGQGFWK